MDSVLASGLRGVLAGVSGASRDAERVTRAFEPDSTEEPVGPLIDLKADQRQVQASAVVIKVGDQLLGSILDILG